MKGFFTVLTTTALVVAFFLSTFTQGYLIALAAQTGATNVAPDQQVADLTQKINQYQAELKKVGAAKNTLENAVKTLSLQTSKTKAQISLTEKNINNVQTEIQQLGAGIAEARQGIDTNQAALAAEIRSLQENDDEPLIIKVLAAGDFSRVWNDVSTTMQVQNSLQEKMENLRNQEQKLASSQIASRQKKLVLADKKEALTSQQESLVQTKKTKEQLLSETDAKESKYQQLLAEAKAELKSFSTFTQKAGGAGLLPGQESCDEWGCYYNQRDTAWGNDALNGTQYRLASDGCLVTSMAMVMTHYGYMNVTPKTINADPSNFASYYPAFLLKTIRAGGVTATRASSAIDAILSGGDPAIVGVHAYGGTHFVVLVSGSNGNYLMRDPYISNGKDINFSDHYSLASVYEINKVEITG
jgi:peptidoglycan hydrolase CwlO-like protein